VAADGKIYLSNEDGEMLVIAAGDKFTHSLDDSIGELIDGDAGLSNGCHVCTIVGEFVRDRRKQ